VLFLAILVGTGWFCSYSCEARELTPKAKQIYQEYHPAIVQIRVLSRGSGEKSALGSGFFFTDSGLIATNYHVVADAVNYPRLYYVECLMSDGQRELLEVLNIDPVHDLAIVRSDKTDTTYVPLGNSQLKKGTKIFSFGNPHDMGMIVIEGLFNGILEYARYEKILFSGSLNPGMSGGPALLDDGTVFGINVSTAGNDISFFVPVEYLKDLHQELEKNDGKSLGPSWSSVIRKRVVRSQEAFIDKIVSLPSWEKSLIGQVWVPSEISPEFKCWGKSGDNRKYWVKAEYLMCSTEDSIRLSSTLSTGRISLDYAWYSSRGDDPLRFYNIFEVYTTNKPFWFINAQERDVRNFSCEQWFVTIDGHRCKVEVCTRSYKQLTGLFDVSFHIMSTDMLNSGFVINGSLEGVTETQGKKFLRKFINEIEWKK